MDREQILKLILSTLEIVDKFVDDEKRPLLDVAIKSAKDIAPLIVKLLFDGAFGSDGVQYQFSAEQLSAAEELAEVYGQILGESLDFTKCDDESCGK